MDGTACCQDFYRNSDNSVDLDFTDGEDECVDRLFIPCPTMDPEVKCTSDRLSKLERLKSFTGREKERRTNTK